MASLQLGWNDLNDEAKEQVAEFYGFANSTEYEANWNADHLIFELFKDSDGIPFLGTITHQ